MSDEIPADIAEAARKVCPYRRATLAPYHATTCLSCKNIAAALWAERKRCVAECALADKLAEALQALVDSPAVLEDARLDYTERQVLVIDRKAAQVLLAEHAKARAK